MRRHSPSRDRGSRRARPPDPLAPSEAPTGFLDAWEQLVGAAGLPTLPRRRGRKPRAPLTDLLPALTFHALNGAGTLAEHFFPCCHLARRLRPRPVAVFAPALFPPCSRRRGRRRPNRGRGCPPQSAALARDVAREARSADLRAAGSTVQLSRDQRVRRASAAGGFMLLARPGRLAAGPRRSASVPRVCPPLHSPAFPAIEANSIPAAR